jgi:hypothetical protein
MIQARRYDARVISGSCPQVRRYDARVISGSCPQVRPPL